jgi:hypothetical protein
MRIPYITTNNMMFQNVSLISYREMVQQNISIN